MLHCRDDLAETLRAVHRIACIRRRLRRSLFRLCGRHADWKRPPDALQLPARCPAPARSLLRTRSDLVPFRPHASNSAPPTTLHGGNPADADHFCSPISLHNINHCPLSHKLPSLPQASTTVPLTQPHTPQAGAPASSCSCAVPDRVEGAGPDAEPEGGEAREPPLYSVIAGRTRLGLLRRVHRQRPRPRPRASARVQVHRILSVVGQLIYQARRKRPGCAPGPARMTSQPISRGLPRNPIGRTARRRPRHTSGSARRCAARPPKLSRIQRRRRPQPAMCR